MHLQEEMPELFLSTTKLRTVMLHGDSNFTHNISTSIIGDDMLLITKYEAKNAAFDDRFVQVYPSNLS